MYQLDVSRRGRETRDQSANICWIMEKARELQKKMKEKESEVAQSCPTHCDPMDCGLPGSSVHGILQARVLEWVAIPFRGSTQPRDHTQVPPKSI